MQDGREELIEIQSSSSSSMENLKFEDPAHEQWDVLETEIPTQWEQLCTRFEEKKLYINEYQKKINESLISIVNEPSGYDELNQSFHPIKDTLELLSQKKSLDTAKIFLFFETLFLFEDTFSDCGEGYSLSILPLIKELYLCHFPIPTVYQTFTQWEMCATEIFFTANLFEKINKITNILNPIVFTQKWSEGIKPYRDNLFEIYEYLKELEQLKDHSELIHAEAEELIEKITQLEQKLYDIKKIPLKDPCALSKKSYTSTWKVKEDDQTITPEERSLMDTLSLTTQIFKSIFVGHCLDNKDVSFMKKIETFKRLEKLLSQEEKATRKLLL